MRMKGKIFPRTSAWLALSIGSLTIAVTAFSYSGSGNRETVRSLAQGFFVEMWKGSQARPTVKTALPGKTPQGRIIQ